MTAAFKRLCRFIAHTDTEDWCVRCGRHITGPCHQLFLPIEVEP